MSLFLKWFYKLIFIPVFKGFVHCKAIFTNNSGRDPFPSQAKTEFEEKKKQNRCFRVFKFNVYNRWGLDALQSKHKPTSLLFILYGYGYVDSYLRSINEFLSISSSPLKMFRCKTYSIFADENTQVGSRKLAVRSQNSKVKSQKTSRSPFSATVEFGPCWIIYLFFWSHHTPHCT